MNKRQTSIFNSNLLTELILGQNALVYENSAPFKALVLLFLNLLAIIKGRKFDQNQSIKGVTANKIAQNLDMALKSTKIRSAVQFYASDIGDEQMYKNVNFSERDLMRGREENRVDRARAIEKAARDHQMALIPYGIVLADIDLLKGSIDQYEQDIPKPDQTRNLKKSATADLKIDFPKIRILINKKMRKGVEQFKDSAPQFYKDMINSFNLDDLPTHHNEFDFICVDKISKTALPGVKMTAYPVSNPSEKLVLYSDMTGEGDFSELQIELWNVEFDLPNYGVVTKTYQPQVGKKLEFTIELEKVS